ncbi:MAG: ATP-binding protein [Verrucomicrobia bacterium]|nr:ATP-binding protein [Verrucomicrobiota bacterium]
MSATQQKAPAALGGASAGRNQERPKPTTPPANGKRIFDPATTAIKDHRPAEIEVSDTEEFLTADGLTRKAGCTWFQLPTLCIKEIVDNSFDYPGASYGYDEETDEHIITDEGPGISKEDIRRLFNIRRPMTSTKRWRRAGRGALGNGLRVACAAVRALHGQMTVASRDGAFRLTFDEIGETVMEPAGPPRDTGTEIRVRIDGKVDEDVIADSTLVPGSIHDGPSNAWAFGMMAFRNITRQCNHLTERQFAAQFGVGIGRDIPLAKVPDEGIKKLHGQLKYKPP